MRIALIGAGSIGAPLAVTMTEKGYDVDVVAHGEEKAKLFREQGFYITGTLGEHHEKLNAFPSVDALNGEYDVCLIATKYQQMPEMARAMLPHLKPNSLVVAVQNGIVIDSLIEVVGSERAVACMIGIGATLKDANHVEVTAGNTLILGMVDDKGDKALLEATRAAMSSLTNTVIDDDIIARLFAKVIFNSTINSLAGITGKTTGYILDTKHAREITLCIIREGVAVADKMGLTLPRFNALPKYQSIAKHTSRPANILLSQFIHLGFWVAAKNVRPSTLQSLEKGNITEIDIMNGYIASKAEELGLKAPVNAQLAELIHKLERKELTIDPSNIYKIETGGN